MNDSFSEVFKGINRVLVVLAHPDDNEVICGGTVARLISEGKKVRLVVTTNGGKGMKNKNFSESDLSTIRVNEQVRACEFLGLDKSEIFNLSLPDGQIETSYENIGKIVYHIREFQPDLIITHNPEEAINTFAPGIHWVNHRDHRNTALITIDAAYPYSRDRGFFPEHFKKDKLQPHNVNKLMFSDSYMHPEVVKIDIAKFIDFKRSALSAHKSVLSHENVEDYISENKTSAGYAEVFRYISIY